MMLAAWRAAPVPTAEKEEGSYCRNAASNSSGASAMIM